MDIFERRWRLIESLLTGPRTRRELVEDLAPNDDAPAVSGSSLSEDVRALRAMDLAFRPLTAEDKKTKQPYELDFTRLPLFVAPDDAEALAVAADLLDHLGLPQAVELERLRARIPAAVRDLARPADFDRLLEASADPPRLETVRQLLAGIGRGSPMWIGYRSVGGAAKRHYVDRAYLAWAEGALYLHAHCPRLRAAEQWQKNLEFRIDRIVGVDGHPPVEVLTGVPAAEPAVPTFELLLWADPGFARRFRPVPGLLSILDGVDGGKILKIRETIPLRAVRRALSYGEHVRVLGPAPVQAMLRDTVARIAAALEGEPE